MENEKKVKTNKKKDSRKTNKNAYAAAAGIGRREEDGQSDIFFI